MAASLSVCVCVCVCLTERELELEVGKTLYYKDCSLGSVKNLSNN